MPRPSPRRERAVLDIPALALPALAALDALVAARRRAPAGAIGARAICAAVRREILDGALGPGARLPSTRALAASLGVARMTVVTAYEQLRAEGYVEGRTGSGTRVTPTLPLRARGVPAAAATTATTATRARDGARATRARPLAAAPATPAAAPSRRGAAYAALAALPELAAVAGDAPVRAFRPGVPALDAFPVRLWSAISARCYRRAGRLLLGEADLRGWRPLREAVVAYLGASRGVRCDADQVVIVTGALQGLQLAARVCLDAGDAAWMEDPGYPLARGALQEAGARVVPVPVDHEGLDVAAGIARAPDARLAFVTPAHQAPLGMVLSVGRRLALLAWARRQRAWIVEDDYDSEFRYAGHPLPALQGLDDAADRVLYLGTFSKTLFPGLRLAYLVVPPALVDAVMGARSVLHRHVSVPPQAATAEFLDGGHFARHLRRMRTLYAERQAALLDAAARELGDVLRVRPEDGGLQLLGWLPPGVRADAAWRAALAAGVESKSLAAFHAEPAAGAAPAAQALMLGYAAVDARDAPGAARRLAAALRPLVAQRRGARRR